VTGQQNNQQNKKSISRMGEIFANHIFDKELRSKIYKELIANSKKPPKPKKFN